VIGSVRPTLQLVLGKVAPERENGTSTSNASVSPVTSV
jgi:hypothetical protein